MKKISIVLPQRKNSYIEDLPVVIIHRVLKKQLLFYVIKKAAY